MRRWTRSAWCSPSSGYSRIPVFRETLDDIVGMLHAFDLFKLQPGDPLPIRPVAVTPASRSCGDLLLDMQRERRHLAVVLDEFGGTLGIATLEDLLEELVGEIFDEHDEEVRAAPGGAGAVFETDGNVSARSDPGAVRCAPAVADAPPPSAACWSSGPAGFPAPASGSSFAAWSSTSSRPRPRASSGC